MRFSYVSNANVIRNIEILQFFIKKCVAPAVERQWDGIRAISNRNK